MTIDDATKEGRATYEAAARGGKLEQEGIFQSIKEENKRIQEQTAKSLKEQQENVFAKVAVTL